MQKFCRNKFAATPSEESAATVRKHTEVER
jgi:hypothetical protein